MITRLAYSLLLILITSACSGQPTTPAADEARQEAAPRVKATNVVPLRELVGKQATVYGRVERTGKSSQSGHNFLNFANTEFSVVCFGPDVAKFKSGAPADIFKGKDVEITGTVQLFRGKLQIELREPSQIKLVEPGGSPPGAEPAEKVELREIGKETWMSPAGLIYRGRDPDGNTRVEHVLRHARDIPSRDGPHGVFDGGEDRAFGIIDEAWELVQKNRIRPQVERGRSAYLVPMGRRVGYLGGRTGASRGRPALNRVFIVVETDTKNVVTAFPR